MLTSRVNVPSSPRLAEAVVTGRRALLVLLLAFGCSQGRTAPGVLVGESAHFRLYLDPDLDMATLPATMVGENGLTALETDWTDKQTMLKMPVGRKIDYHLLTTDHISSFCGFNAGSPGSAQDGGVGTGSYSEDGCETGGGLVVAAGFLPHQHELMHAYLSMLAPGPLPIPLVTEGGASAIGCNTEEGSSLEYFVPWQTAVVETAADASRDVYTEGGLLARFLIRTQGADAFVRYYRQAPERLDPALFAANFLHFWEMSIDDVWSEMHAVPADSNSFDATICPCALPALPTDGTPINDDPDTHPYWPLDLAAGESLSLMAPDRGQLPNLLDCQGLAAEVVPVSTFGAVPVVQVFASDGPTRYLPSAAGVAAAGAYVTDSCAATVPTPLPAGILHAGGRVEVVVQPLVNPSSSTTLYLQLQLPIAALVTSNFVTAEYCGSCALDQGSCQTAPNADAGSAFLEEVSVPAGPLYVRVTLGPEEMLSSPQIFFTISFPL